MGRGDAGTFYGIISKIIAHKQHFLHKIVAHKQHFCYLCRRNIAKTIQYGHIIQKE